MTPPATAPSASMWTPLRRVSFRWLLGSGGIYFLGNAMHTMAVSWLMVEITGSPFLSALVQTRSEEHTSELQSL